MKMKCEISLNELLMNMANRFQIEKNHVWGKF